MQQGKLNWILDQKKKRAINEKTGEISWSVGFKEQYTTIVNFLVLANMPWLFNISGRWAQSIWELRTIFAIFLKI